MNTHKATIALFGFLIMSLHIQGSDDVFAKTCREIYGYKDDPMQPNSNARLLQTSFKNNLSNICGTESSLENVNEELGFLLITKATEQSIDQLLSKNNLPATYNVPIASPFISVKDGLLKQSTECVDKLHTLYSERRDIVARWQQTMSQQEVQPKDKN